MDTRSIKGKEVEERWFIVDAEGVRLGKVATKVASLLNAKDDVKRVDYLTPKNKVIVINSQKVDVHPRKRINKKYYRHSGYPGGFTEMEYDELQAKNPNRIIELAIKGMLPKTKQRDVMMTNLFIYENAEHKHEAQKPEIITI